MLKDLLDDPEPEEESIQAQSPDGAEYIIPSRKDMENMAMSKNQFENLQKMEEGLLKQSAKRN